MAVAQLWRFNATAQQWECKGRPPRPVPPVGTQRYDLITELTGASTYSAPPPFTIGTTKPDATNTGVPQGMALQPRTVSGDTFTVSQAGAVYDGIDFYATVLFAGGANNVTFRNCRFRGKGTAFNGYGTVDCSNVSGTLFERCTMKPDTPLWWLNGVKAGPGTIVRRCDISYGVDGVNYALATGSMTMEGCYVHDFAFFDNSGDHASDAVWPGWTHNDGIQISGGSGHVIKGNNFQAFASPNIGMPQTLLANGFPQLERPNGVTCSPDKSNITNTLVTLNWFEGGESGFQMNGFYGSTTSADFGEISYNRFGMGQHNFGNNSRYQIRYKSTGYTIRNLETNYFDPDAPTVPAALKGVTFTVGFTGGIRIP